MQYHRVKETECKQIKRQKTRIKTRGTKRKLSIKKEHNKKKKDIRTSGRIAKSIPGPVTRLKSKTDTSSKGATERLQNAHQSTNRRGKSPLFPKS